MVFGHEPPSIRRLLRSKGMRRLRKAMESLPEPKQIGKVRHPTWRCLMIVLLSLTSGRDWVLDAHFFAVRHARQLGRLFGKGYSTPSYCTLVRALHKIGPECRKLTESMGFAIGGSEGCQMDGKLVRATKVGASPNSALDIVELRLGSGMADFESCGPGGKERSELAAMAALVRRNAKRLRRLAAPLTIDAIAANSRMTSLLHSLGIPFCVCIRNEGKGLGEAVASDFLARRDEVPIREARKIGGRMDVREYFFAEDPSPAWLIYGKGRWKGVAHFGMVRRKSMDLRTGETAEQVRYYLISEGVDAKGFKEARSRHWSIESSHWVIDNSFREDRHRLGQKDRPAALAMGILRRKAFEEIRSCLRPGMDFAKARRELSAEGFRETLYVLSGKAARAASKIAGNDQK